MSDGWTPEHRAFADSVGETGPVWCVGNGSQDRLLASTKDAAGIDCRSVSAPNGIRSIVPAEMIVRVGAGTPLVDLHLALGEAGLRSNLPGGQELNQGSGTVGGALAVGHGGHNELLAGPPRDTVLEVRYVNAQGQLTKTGGPVVKNVSGFDLCRLLVGSFGTLGFMAEVVLRAGPGPAAQQWYSMNHVGDLSALSELRNIYRPASVLISDELVTVLLEGNPLDVASQGAKLERLGFKPTEHGLPLEPWRLRVERGTEVEQAQKWRTTQLSRGVTPSDATYVALAGTGMVSLASQADARPVPEGVRMLNKQLKSRLDPTGRLNPGLDVLRLGNSAASDATKDQQ